MKRRPTYCIIVAAGTGSRFGGNLPKQFCRLGGRPALMTTIERLRGCLQPEDHIAVVLSQDFTGLWEELCRLHGFRSPKVVTGGATRWQSVKNALKVMPFDAHYVMVHDGARPLVQTRVVDDLYRRLEKEGAEGVIPATKMTDSLRRLLPEGKSEAVNRSDYRGVQTPQLFHAGTLCLAYDQPYSEAFTDDASVVEAFTGEPVSLVEGAVETLKITHPADLVLVDFYLRKENEAS